jgi:nucleotide-binding universal stress UspA family protein
MDRLKNLTFAVDFSACSRNAPSQAARIARWNGVRLQALHVVDAPAVSDLAGVLGVPVEEVRAQAVHTAPHELERWVQQADALHVRLADFVRQPEAPELRWHIVAAHRSGQGIAGCARQIKGRSHHHRRTHQFALGDTRLDRRTAAAGVALFSPHGASRATEKIWP